MNLLDRYIARQYMVNALALLVILSSFVVTIDVSLNFNRFVGVADKLLKATDPDPTLVRRGVTTLLLVADLWWPRLLQLFNYMLGLVLVGAMGFTFSQLVRGRELVAVLASGQSLYRVARPVLVVAAILTGVQGMNQELVVPRIAGLLTRDHGDAGKRDLGSARLSLTSDSQGRLFYARAFNADSEIIEDITVVERDAQRLGVRRITAKSAHWRDGGWDLEGGMAENREGRLGPPSPVTRIVTDLDPTVLKMRRYAGYSQSLGFAQVGQLITDAPALDAAARDRLERIRWGRFSIMLSNFLALVVSMPFFLRREPANMVLQSLKCAPVAVIALMGGVLGAAASIPGIPPQLGVFVPVLVLMPMAIAATASVRT